MRATTSGRVQTRRPERCAARATQPVRWIAIPSLILCASAAYQAQEHDAATAPPTVEPLRSAWRVELAGGCEWAEVVAGERPVVVVASPRGEVYVLDAATGTSRAAAPLMARPGVRFGAALGEPGTALLLDRFSVYALSARRSNPLLWQRGEPPAEGRLGEGDPEFLPRILDATAIGPHVLVAHADGRVERLAAADGSLQQVISLPATRAARLVSVSRAALDPPHRIQPAVWWVGLVEGRARAALPPLEPGAAAPRAVPIGDALPGWLGVTAAGELLAAWPNELLQASRRGDAERLPVPFTPLVGSNLAVHELDVGPGESDPLLLASPRDGPLCAVRIADGTTTWQAARDPAPREWVSVQTSGTIVAVVARSALEVRDVRNGACLGAWSDVGARVVRVALHPRHADALVLSIGGANPTALIRLTYPSCGAARAPLRAFSVPRDGKAPEPRDALLLPDRLIIVEPAALHAYHLP